MAGERILIVEDDPELLAMMAQYLKTEGYGVELASEGIEGLNLWRNGHPDLVILDWMLPGMSGLEIVRKIRASDNVPVLMVTARGEDSDVVVGLELGADDYLIKPVSLRQLSARVRAVFRRTRGNLNDLDVVVFGPLRIDFMAHSVECHDQAVSLTVTEFKILEVLARHPNRVFSRLQLMEAALGEYYEGYERTVDSHVSRIRAKIGLKALIHAVYGMGYKLVPEGW